MKKNPGIEQFRVILAMMVAYPIKNYYKNCLS